MLMFKFTPLRKSEAQVLVLRPGAIDELLQASSTTLSHRDAKQGREVLPYVRGPAYTSGTIKVQSDWRGVC